MIFKERQGLSYYFQWNLECMCSLFVKGVMCGSGDWGEWLCLQHQRQTKRES